MIVRAGRPFWSGFTAFAASMVSLLSLDKFSITDVNVMVNWGGAIVSSLFVAAVVYGEAKIARSNGKKEDHG